ncbi:hypothetical protein Clacol_005421 [Clathrus columnatus]|uniref:Dienelactone hydrolase domain-containing protein n=1 Tax=Clathrus columnatus TaxID=1419009 RepID=A0AAV5A999_9AGAM|nr:hypothetical protein Clacol_005421 [Clathrus columnatus]
MSFCEDCVKQVVHDGTPRGTIQTIGGITTYVALPSGDYDKTKAVLFLTDIFGLTLVNNKADAFADNGYATYVPEYLNGDAFPADGDFSKLGEWFANHTAVQTRPPLDAVINKLKEEGITSFGATGYCFGGRYVFDLSFENIIKASVVAHPSLLQVPGDLNDYVEKSKAPLLICAAEEDGQYPVESQKIGDTIFAALGDNYKRAYFPGTSHGFAVRGDLSNPQVKAGNEGALKEAVSWFKKHL